MSLCTDRKHTVSVMPLFNEAGSMTNGSIEIWQGRLGACGF